MRYIILIITALAWGCGEEDLQDGDVIEYHCEHYDELYSHSVVFCGGYGMDSIHTSFVACNSRVPRSQHREGCLDDYDLVDINEGCFMQHICQEELVEEE